MQLTVLLKLAPNSQQRAALMATLERANAACNFVSSLAWERQVFNKYGLHGPAYREVRERFGLSAQLTTKVINKVGDAYAERSTLRNFHSRGAVSFDSRILRYLPSERVSIWTLAGRQTISYVCPERQRALLLRQKGESKLVYRDGDFYLAAPVEVDETPAIQPSDALGLDLGIVNIATDSGGETYSGGHLNGLRRRHAVLRRKLQKKGTRSAKRLLRKRRRKEALFARDVNHCISKKVVAKAQRTNRAVALEDLKGIRERVRVRKPQRRQHHSWSFHQLRSFVEYKAKLAGVPIVVVDPRNTSRTCPECGSVDKRNRPSQAKFSCVCCGFAGPADHIAARNIAVLGRAATNRPDAATLTG